MARSCLKVDDSEEGKGGAVMTTTGLMKRDHGFVEPARHRSMIESKIGEHQERFVRHKARQSADMDDTKKSFWQGDGVHTVGTTTGGFLVGLMQGRYGTTRIGGLVPAELLVGAVLHTAALFSAAKPLRTALRAVGNGMFAMGAGTVAYGLLAKREPAPPAGQPKTAMRGLPEPETGGAALSDVELARFATRR